MVDTFTVYASGGDKALKLSDILSLGQARFGQLSVEDYPPSLREMIAVLPNNEFIYVSADTGGLGHSYFHSNPAVSSDLILLMRDDRLAGEDSGRPLRKLGPNFWDLADGYPHSGKKP